MCVGDRKQSLGGREITAQASMKARMRVSECDSETTHRFILCVPAGGCTTTSTCSAAIPTRYNGTPF